MTDPQAQAQARDALTAARDAAKDFAKQHVAELAKNINQWQDTGLLPAGCRLRELHAICRPLGNSDTMALAEAFADRACRDVAALASAPAAHPYREHLADQADAIDLERLAKALTIMGAAGPHGQEDCGARLAEMVNCLTSAVERVGQEFAPTPQDTVPAAEPDAAPAFAGEEHVRVPRMLIGAACSAIDKKRDAPKILSELRRYTTGDLSAQPAAQAEPVYTQAQQEVWMALSEVPCDCSQRRREEGEHLSGCHLFDVTASIEAAFRATPPSPTEQQQPLEPDTASLAMSGRSTDFISGYERGFEAGVDAARAAQDKKGGE